MLQRVRIQNFKSLKDVTLDLQKVNLFIGPNNSGKSNFLKGLEFVKKHTENYFDIDKGITFQQNTNEITITLISNNGIDQDYPFESCVFKQDFRGGQTLQIFHHKTKEDEMKLHQKLFTIDISFLVNIERNHSEYAEIYKYAKREYTDLRVYKIDPNPLNKPFPIIPNQVSVSENASNLIAFLDVLRDKFPDNFKNIENDIQKCIPEFSGLRFENVNVSKEDDLYKIYGDKTFKKLGLHDKINNKTYWADELSEGVLYFLALLCIVHQPNPPKLLLLEEPEKGIHPRRIKEVMDFIFQLAEEKDIQVIMTTHNERVLNEFEDIPEAVFIFDKDDEGATFIKNLQKDIIEPSDKEMEEKGYPKIKFTESLGSHWLTGFIGGVPK